jgi:hypothetical protein
MANSKLSAKAEFWQQVLDEYRQCGSTVKSFCASKGISVPSFYQWKQRLQSKPAVPSNHSIVPVKLISVQPRTSDSNRFVQIFTPSGFSIRIDSAMPPDDLAGLLHAVESCTRGGA